MNQYFIHDARKVDELPIDSSVDVVITSPPYFDMKDYGSKNQIGFGQSYEKYLDDIELVFKKCFKITKDTGSLWVVVDILRKDGELKLLPFDMAQKIQKGGWHLQDIVIWEKDKTVPYTHNGEMRNISEYILYFNKSARFKFYRERITTIHDLKEWWQRYPERYSPNGKSPTNIWSFAIPLQGSWGKTYIKHFCPLPEKLMERIIHLSSDIDDVVLDPFAGSGAVLSAAYRLNRKYVGCDLNKSYREMFFEYIKTVRPLDTKKAYEDNAMINFSKTIEKLRILKFPKKLLLEYKKKFPDIFDNLTSIIVLPNKLKKDFPKNKFITATYVLITKNPSFISEDNLLKIANNPPLSKYGIYPDIQIMTSEKALRLLKAKYSNVALEKYEGGITYKVGIHIKKINKMDLEVNENNKFPHIISSFVLKEDELSIKL